MTPDAYLLAADEGQALWFLRNRMTVKATVQSTGGAYGLLESLIAPGFSPPLHVHHREDEAFYVIEGTLTMRCGDRTFRAEPGSFVFLPRDVHDIDWLGEAEIGPDRTSIGWYVDPGLAGAGVFVDAINAVGATAAARAIAHCTVGRRQ